MSISLMEAVTREESLHLVWSPVAESRPPSVTKRERVKRPTILQDIFRQRHQQRSVYYFTQGRTLNQTKMRDFSKEKTPYWFPPNEEEFSYKVVHKVWRDRFREEEKKYKYYNRPNYRSRQTVDLLERLHIPDDAKSMPKIPGILDIDPQYYSIVAGRPVKDNTDIRTYILNVQATLKTRLHCGFVSDNVLKLEEQLYAEQDRIDAVNEEHKIYLDQFDKFLESDYESSMASLSRLDKAHGISRDKASMCRELNRDVGTLKSRLYNLEEQWRNLKLFQTILYKVSPLKWRAEYDYINLDSQKGDKKDDVFEKYRLATSGSVSTLETLIDMFIEDTRNEPPPLLYFTEPDELLSIYESMAHRNLNALLLNELIMLPLEELKVGLVENRVKIKEEMTEIEDRVNDLEMGIKYEEERADALEKLADDMIYTIFKKLIVSDDTLHMFTYIENAYKDVFQQKEGRSSMSKMMKLLEIEMSDLLLSLDYLPKYIVQEAESYVRSEHRKVMKESKESWRKKLIIDSMFASLSKAFEPARLRYGKELKPRSYPPPMKKIPPKPEPPLTEEQVDMLTYFTNYCHHVDDFKIFFDVI